MFLGSCFLVAESDEDGVGVVGSKKEFPGGGVVTITGPIIASSCLAKWTGGGGGARYMHVTGVGTAPGDWRLRCWVG